MPHCTCIGLDYGPLSFAVAANDVDQVNHILTNHPTMIQERNLLGQTPLHLATANPDCLQLLIRFANDDQLNILDNDGFAPVHYALARSRRDCRARDAEDLCDDQCPCIRSIEILLHADCSVYIFPIFGSSRAGMKFAEGMRDRRERLRFLAMRYLPPSEIEDLILDGSQVLDSRTKDVIKRLQRYGITIPTALDFEHREILGKSVYHYLDDVNIANYFFDLGFRDVDTPDSEGFTPLATIDFIHSTPYGKPLLYALWLVKHGARLFHRLEYPSSVPPDRVIRGATSAHFALGHIGQWLEEKYDRAELGDDPLDRDAIVRLSTQILPFDERDDCDCRCCLGGCSPFIWMLKEVTAYQNKFETHQYQFIYWYLENFDFAIGQKHHLDAIRWATFEMLGLQHTCCYTGMYRVQMHDADEIREIEEEQAASLECLENLVGDFQRRVTEILERDDANTLADLKQFWTDYWYNQVERALTKLDGDNLTDEERKRAEDIGVKWIDESNDEEEKAEEEDRNNMQDWFRRMEEIG